MVGADVRAHNFREKVPPVLLCPLLREQSNRISALELLTTVRLHRLHLQKSSLQGRSRRRETQRGGHLGVHVRTHVLRARFHW